MKKILFITAMALACADASQAQNLRDTIYYNDDWQVVGSASDASFFRLYDGADKSDGLKPFKDFYITGELQEEGTFFYMDPLDDEQSIIDGVSTQYYKNGNKRAVWTYSRGILQGYYAKYDSTGAKQEEGSYKNGLLDGKLLQYLEGKVSGEEYFEEGVCQKDITFFYNTDSVMEIFTLIDRQEKTFTANKTRYFTKEQSPEVGKVSADYIFDFSPSIWEYPFQFYYIWVSEFGEKRKIKTNHGKYQEFDYEGRILKDGKYENGEKVGEWKYYNYDQNVYRVTGFGRIDTPDHYFTLDGKEFSGEYVGYHSNGKVSVTGNCINGLKEGIWTMSDSLGRKSTENTFKKGKLHGKTVEYYYWDETETEPYCLCESNFEDFDLEGLVETKYLFNGKWETIESRNFRNGKHEGHSQFLDDDGLLVICNYKNDSLDGDFFRYSVDNVGDIITKKYLCLSNGKYCNGKQTGIWTYYNYYDNVFLTRDYGKQNSPCRYYTLSGKPFTGTLRDSYDREDGDDDSVPDTAVIIIKKSLIQRVEYKNSKTGKVIATDVYKKGVKVE